MSYLSQIPLYGYIDNNKLFSNSFDDNIIYVLTETIISPTKYKYKGIIGYGYLYNYNEENNYNIKYNIEYYISDYSSFNFIYDIENNKVIINTQCRIMFYPETINIFNKNITSDYKYIKDEYYENDDENKTYYYIQFPITKDGIPVLSIINNLFKDKNINIYIPSEYIYTRIIN